MTTQELKNKIEKVLGNNIRCLLPSYWWKNLFHSVADRIDEVETTITENVNDMVVKSLKEFEAKYPDIERSTLYYTTDENSALARSNVAKILRWELAAGSTTPNVLKPLHIAIPFITIGDEVSAYIIQSPMYALDIFTESILFADVPFKGKSNIYINIHTGVATLKPASSSGGGSVMFVVDPLGDLTEEQKQGNADAYLKVIEAEGAIDISILLMFFIAKPNVVSFDNNENLVLTAAGIDGGASKFIFTPEGDVTIEKVASEGFEIRELHISQLSLNDQITQETQLTDEQKAWNLETIELVKQKKAIAAVNVNSVSILLQTHVEEVAALWGYMGDGDEDLFLGLFYDAQGNTNVNVGIRKPIDFEMSDTSENAVQNKVIKAYVDDKVAAIDFTVDAELSQTSTNAVQNKAVYSEMSAVIRMVIATMENLAEVKADINETDKVTAAALNDLNKRLQDITTILNNAGLGNV